MVKKVIISVGIIIGIVALMVFKLLSNKREIDSRREIKVVAAPVAVTVAEVRFQVPEARIGLVGNTEAGREVKVSSKSTGEIVEINFKLGDYVSRGSVLARVDDTYTRLALENATINHDKLKDDIQRYETLRAGDAITEVQLRDIKIAYESATVQLRQVRQQLDDTYIRAPFGGYVTSRDIEIGKFVSAGTPVASLADIAELNIAVSVTEAHAYRLRRGQNVTVTTQVYPGITFAGKVAHVSPQGDNAHSYPVTISLSNSDRHPLKAGTYVNVSIDLGDLQPILSIPRDAIVSSVQNPAVYRIENGNIARLVPIIVGKDYDNNIEVLQGLAEGDLVVVSGQINLMDGAEVVKN
jgi:RND family efflux transporter MFP subunit